MDEQAAQIKYQDKILFFLIMSKMHVMFVQQVDIETTVDNTCKHANEVPHTSHAVHHLNIYGPVLANIKLHR